jgi:hypothetical protein
MMTLLLVYLTIGVTFLLFERGRREWRRWQASQTIKRDREGQVSLRDAHRGEREVGGKPIADNVLFDEEEEGEVIPGFVVEEGLADDPGETVEEMEYWVEKQVEREREREKKGSIL